MEARILISAEQIRSIAREEELPAAVVEKDYALTWLLRGFYLNESKLRKSLILKGGTAIRKAYFPQTWRFSEDLDFTATQSKNGEAIKNSMEQILVALRSEAGIRYSIHSFHTTEGAAIANIQYLGPLNFTGRIKHDISLKEKLVLKPESHKVKTNFPDLPEFKILVYPLAEIIAEKIRSIMQRGYSRDYYDVWRLLNETDLKTSDMRKLVIQKCELNAIKYQPELIFDENRLDEAHAFWIKGLRHLTKNLPEFDIVIRELKITLSPLVGDTP